MSVGHLEIEEILDQEDFLAREAHKDLKDPQGFKEIEATRVKLEVLDQLVFRVCVVKLDQED